jgi:membrane protein DedA with SNARE-associated domain
MSVLLIVIGYTLAMGVGYCIGHAFGRQRGRDEQWVDDYIKYEKQIQASRDRNGRFVSKRIINK